MYADTCNSEEMVQLTPYAVIYMFQAALGLFVTTLHWTSFCSAKTV